MKKKTTGNIGLPKKSHGMEPSFIPDILNVMGNKKIVQQKSLYRSPCAGLNLLKSLEDNR